MADGGRQRSEKIHHLEYTLVSTNVGISTSMTLSSSFANYDLGKTAQNKTYISVTEAVNTVLENV